MLPRRRAIRMTVLALAFVRVTLSLLAQHPPIERPPEAPRDGVPERGSERDSELPKAFDGHIHVPAGHHLLTPEDRIPQVLRWEKSQDPSGRASWAATSPSAGSATMDLGALKHSLERGRIFINEGSLPRGNEWRLLNDAYPDQMITHEPESANRDSQAIRDAIHLGERPLDPARVKVFNALPHETGMQEHFQEQNRMGIGGTLDYWKGLHQDIHARSAAVLPHRATKEAVLEELRSGTSDVLILYAHFDGEHLYMPGAKGGTISIQELAKIDRTRDPRVRERVIILVACKAGARTPEDPRSLSSVLLQKGIARTVMATDRPYDSREIPALLMRLANGAPLRTAVGRHPPSAANPQDANPAHGARPMQGGSYLQQFVELQFWQQNNGYRAAAPIASNVRCSAGE